MRLVHPNIVLLAAVLFVGCAGSQPSPSEDARALLIEGRFAEARKAALRQGDRSPENRGIIALATLARSPTSTGATEAVIALTEGASGVGATVAAAQLLTLTGELQAPPNSDLAVLIAEAALGGAGQGPYTPKGTLPIPVGTATRQVASKTLERMFLSLAVGEMTIDTKRLLRIWNGCFTLLGGVLETPDDATAWSLFRSIGGLAIVLHNGAPDDELAQVLLRSAVAVIESNPSIALAARCDLATPFDALRTSIKQDRALARQLEQAVASAAGCSRGTHAPAPTD